MGILSALIDEVEGAIKDVTSEASKVVDLKDSVVNAINPLKNGGWTGKGAEAFFQAAETELIKQAENVFESISGLSGAINGALDIIKEADKIASGPIGLIEGAIDAIGDLF